MAVKKRREAVEIQAIARRVPGFTMRCEPDFRQAIADSWPARIDDGAAQRDWGWRLGYELQAMVDDMLANLRPLLQGQATAALATV